jgi:hypothetical protein
MFDTLPTDEILGKSFVRWRGKYTVSERSP